MQIPPSVPLDDPKAPENEVAPDEKIVTLVPRRHSDSEQTPNLPDDDDDDDPGPAAA
jgi:hypothetical protein